MNNMKITALVPIRHHSQRVPGKNYRPLAGKPLYQYIIETLLACPEIERVVVDTDSSVVQDGLAAVKHGAIAVEGEIQALEPFPVERIGFGQAEQGEVALHFQGSEVRGRDSGVRREASRLIQRGAAEGRSQPAARP